jgi:hypothetical protein
MATRKIWTGIVATVAILVTLGPTAAADEEPQLSDCLQVSGDTSDPGIPTGADFDTAGDEIWVLVVVNEAVAVWAEVVVSPDDCFAPFPA